MAAAATARTSKPARRSTARRSTAQRVPARKSGARKTTPRRRSRQTPITGFVPVAVGRTAGAVGGLADSGLVVRLTRSRLWIGLLGALLVGIVALNVIALSFSASSSDAARRAEELKRQNSALQGDIATRLSSPEIQAAAAELGLYSPEAGSIRYLRPSADDAAEAARRLRSGELGSADYATPVLDAAVAPVEAAPVETAPVIDPAAVAPAGEVAPEAAAAPEDSVAPEAEVAPETLPEAPPAVPVDGGGVAAP
jgi:hypothetical protein